MDLGRRTTPRWICALLVGTSLGVATTPELSAQQTITATEIDVSADSIYWQGRRATTEENHPRAVELFQAFRESRPDSRLVPASLYWEAFNRRRIGGEDQLRAALELLDEHAERFPDTYTSGVADILRTQIQGDLATAGDSVAGRSILTRAVGTFTARELEPPDDTVTVGPIVATFAFEGCDAGDGQVRVSALSSLVTIDPDRAMDLMQEIAGSTEPCSAALRTRMPSLLSRIDTDEAWELLERVTLNAEESATFDRGSSFLVGSTRPGLDERLAAVVTDANRSALARSRALTTLGRRRNPEAREALRTLAAEPGLAESTRTRVEAILEAAGAAGVIRPIPRPPTSRPDSADRIGGIAILTEASDPRDLTEIIRERALDPERSADVRDISVRWVIRRTENPAEAVSFYRELEDVDLRMTAIETMGERDEPPILDLLIEVARSEEDPRVRSRAVEALARFDDPAAAVALVEILRSGGGI